MLSNTAEVHNGTLLFAAALTAAFPAEPDSRILRLITPETYKVAGIDSERYQQTNLAAHFPASTSGLLLDVPPQSARVRGIITIASRDQPELTILTGDFAPRIPAHHEGWRAVSPQRIAGALQQRLEVRFVPQQPGTGKSKSTTGRKRLLPA